MSDNPKDFSVNRWLNEHGDDVSNHTGAYKAFEAFKNNRKGARFDILMADGRRYLCAYSYMSFGMYHPRGFLSFSSGHGAITIEGKGLEKLCDLLLEERVKRIIEFNPETDEEPKEGDAVVTKVHIKSPLDPHSEGFDG